MITAKEIREIKFSRSMGGYKTAEVDDFLDRCADAVEELTKTNDENERKMQVLAETVMDYRNQEDSIRSALISAQRMSESVISEARKQADDIREAARTEADTMREKAASEITAELQELRRIKQEVADFKAALESDKYKDYAIRFWYNGNGKADIAHDEHDEFCHGVVEAMPDRFTDGENFAWIDLRDGSHAYQSWLVDLYNCMLVFFK